MKCFGVKFVRTETYVQQTKIFATTKQEAKSLANEMLENGDVSFDHRKISEGTERVAEVVEIEQRATATLEREQFETLLAIAERHYRLLARCRDSMPRSEWCDDLLLNNKAHGILEVALA